MSELRLFDCNTRIGPWVDRRPWQFTTTEGLLQEMDRVGIAEALVHSATASDHAPAMGNEELTEQLDGHERLHPCWVLMPHHTGEMDPPEQLVATMLEQGVRAARMFPKRHQFLPIQSICGSLLDALAAHKIPLFIDIGETSWGEINDVLGRHPGLQLIVQEAFYRIDRYVYPLMERHSGLHLETATYVVHRGIEAVCEQFGPERLVFGTAMPIRDPGGAISPITYLRLSDEDKRLIAGDNLRRLLEGVC
ncbi:MAG: amidohydrolase family protein [Armatimonadota bacterium]